MVSSRQHATPNAQREDADGVALTRGLNPNDSTTQHELKSVPGKFSAVHLLCLMYVAFKIIAPDETIGFDLSAEYQSAMAMHRRPSSEMSSGRCAKNISISRAVRQDARRTLPSS